MEKVAIHDVKDAEAFVIAAMRTSGITPGRDETEDVIGAGLLVLLEMGARFQPRLAGYERNGRFSGYASKYLPGRIRDAYFQMHENIVVRVDATGHKRREFLPHPVRLSPPSDWSEMSSDPGADMGGNDGAENDADDRALAVADQLDPLLDLWTSCARVPPRSKTPTRRNATSMPAPTIPTAVTARANGSPPHEFLNSIHGALHGQLASEYQFTARVAWLRGLDLDRTAIVRYLAPCTDLDVRMAIERLKRIGRDLNEL